MEDMIYIDDKIDQLDIDAAFASVSEQRRNHALSYRQEHDRRLSLAAYRLLQRALNVDYGISDPPLFSFGEHGKPMLVGHPDIHFSLSHCREAAACVVAPVPVGIDVESLISYDAELVEKVMNVEEQQQIARSSDPALDFIRLWTMKESLLKMTGEGISTDLRSVLDGFYEKNGAFCRFFTTIYPKFVCSTCYKL